MLDLLFPPRCPMCGEVLTPLESVCPSCRLNNRFLKGDRCVSCGMPLDECFCKRNSRRWDGVTSAFLYQKECKTGVLNWKYTKNTETTGFWAQAVAGACKETFGDVGFDLITFVPQTENDMLEKGYNQGELLARAVGIYMRLPVEKILTKLYDSPRQHSMPRIKRTGNVFGVFEPVDKFSVPGKTILLVDDILTTGSTLEECSKMLKLYDAEAVYCAVIAQVRPDI
ncbi:MAG: double zinc ribbon domain-containing protein [Clostridia bacterium]|nr:double zinc ribbon domain-containing protein [Clostridia bacterium]